MPRSVWKGPFVAQHLIKAIEKIRNSGRLSTPCKTYSRASVIIPEFVGFTIEVYNGRKFIPLSVTENMIGHKLGEFSPTRTFPGHAGDSKAKKK